MKNRTIVSISFQQLSSCTSINNVFNFPWKWCKLGTNEYKFKHFAFSQYLTKSNSYKKTRLLHFHKTKTFLKDILILNLRTKIKTINKPLQSVLTTSEKTQASCNQACPFFILEPLFLCFVDVRNGVLASWNHRRSKQVTASQLWLSKGFSFECVFLLALEQH